MPLNPEIYTTTSIKRSTLETLRAGKTHKRDTDYELIERAVEKAEAYDHEHELIDMAMNNDVEITED